MWEHILHIEAFVVFLLNFLPQMATDVSVDLHVEGVTLGDKVTMPNPGIFKRKENKRKTCSFVGP